MFTKNKILYFSLCLSLAVQPAIQSYDIYHILGLNTLKKYYNLGKSIALFHISIFYNSWSMASHLPLTM